jgi:hypothetical protein
MAAQELSETSLEALLSQVHVHTIDLDAFRLLIEGSSTEQPTNEFADIIAHALSGTIFVTSRSGTRYQVDFDGPTKDKIYFDGPIKVRWATYIPTKTNGTQEEHTGYIGLSTSDSMQFFTNLNDEKPASDEHTIVRNSSGVLDREVQLVIDWSK